jgi:AraC-like DNA-binding protein/quercetin dioxygenase-like cupin family protein
VGVCPTGAAPQPAARAGGHALPVRLVHRWLPAGGREGIHTHAFVELCHVQSGRGVLTAAGRPGVAPAHTVTVLPPGTPHALAADGSWTCNANLLHFDPQVLPPGDGVTALTGLLRLAAAGRGCVYLRGAAGQSVEALLVQVGNLSRGGPAAADACRQALADLCCRLWRAARDARVAQPGRADLLGTLGRRPAPAGAARQTPAAPPRGGQTGTSETKPTSPAAARPEIEAALEYIERNLTRPITRQELARQAAFAPSYFSSLFREATGTTIPEYLNMRRVLRAQELLRDPQMRVSAVCYAVGFRDLSNFNRVFKRIVGQTPREYRLAVLGEAYEGAEADAADEAGGTPGGAPEASAAKGAD